MKIPISVSSIVLLLTVGGCAGDAPQQFGETVIAKWQDGKTGAISITYDDGIITQFTKALPTMNRLGLPATFFIVTGEIAGSAHPPRFIGRPLAEIVEETRTVPTNAENFLERASALEYPGYDETFELHRDASSPYERGDLEEAYRVIDDAYARIRAGEFEPGPNINPETAQSAENSWDDFRRYAAQGHEFGSHTVTHAALSVLDEPNMLYELEKSREDIADQLGREHTFSIEGPFGVSDERVMDYLLEAYPAPRNIMRHPYLDILLRGDDEDPGASDREYVQWQRGPDGTLHDGNDTSTSLETMQSWVDTVLANDNVWLVLVFHGVDEVGWSAMPHERIEAYFEYIKEHEGDLWVATFGDVTKYVRERMNATVAAEESGDELVVSLTHSLDGGWYDLPLTLETEVPTDWRTVIVRQGDREQKVDVQINEDGGFVLYQAVPNQGPAVVARSME